MKILKVLVNLLGIFAAILLSLLLTTVLFVSPFISTATSFMRGDNLHNLFKSIDYSELLGSYLNTTATTEINGIDPSVLNDFIDSELVGEVLELYIDSLFASIEGESSEFTVEAVKKIANEHKDELLPIVKSYIGTDLPLSDEQLLSLADTTFDSVLPKVINAIPTLEDLGLEPPMLSFLRKLHNGTYLTYIICISALLSLLIVLCRFPRFKGFMWLGVVYPFSAIVLLILALLSKTIDFLPLIPASPILHYIVAPLYTTVSLELFKGAGIIALLGIVFILIFVFGRKYLKQKETLQKAAT